MQDHTKHRIHVSASTQYLPDQSQPDHGRYVFAYTITISNTGTVPARLLTRHWIITDANDKVQEVRGDGVVGQQPYLAPGMSFEYTSGTMIETSVGTMHGSYQMIDDDGSTFSTEIPQFTLSIPRTLH
ncbi:MAG: Co2+/Mg2+ efflux protein ApaG [Proteobacteria bacterium]|nr:Co2+/Mg2+ efflux protein ApaG [Pseudomonadota bacterium]